MRASSICESFSTCQLRLFLLHSRDRSAQRHPGQPGPRLQRDPEVLEVLTARSTGKQQDLAQIKSLRLGLDPSSLSLEEDMDVAVVVLEEVHQTISKCIFSATICE
ncbi:hypothetical protein BsWGS_13732 [Bradybaena similaris]